MAQRNIDFGTFPDDPQADAIRTAFQKVQENFSEVYAGVEGASVASVNRTPGAGITVSSPTGNVIVTANIACVQVHTSTLSIGRDSNGAQDTSITSSSQTLWVDLPATIANVTNINLTGNLNANYVTSNLQLNGNIGNFSGNVTASNLIANSRVTATGNITGGNLTTAGRLSVTGNANVGNLGTAGLIVATGNVSGGNLTTAGVLSVTGNANVGNIGATTAIITTGNITTINSGLLQNGNSNITVTANGNISLTAAGGATPEVVITSTGVNITGTLNTSSTLAVTGNANVGNLGTAGLIVATGNVTGGNLTTGGVVSATGNVTGGNINTAGAVTASTLVSNVTTGTAPLTVTSTTRVSNLNVNYANVADFINVAAGTGNNYLIFANAATGNVSELTSTGLTANLSNNSITATTFVGALSGAATSATTAGTVTTNAQPNITSVGTLTSLGVTGTTTSGNFATAGNITASFLVSNVATGTAPLTVTSTTVVPNLYVARANVADNINVAAGTGNNYLIFANAATGNIAELTSTGLTANLSNNSITATTFVGALSGAATTAGTVTTNAQPNITSVGTLTGLTVNGIVNTTGASNVSLGAISQIRITGGTAGYTIKTDGLGNLSWGVDTAAAGGSNTQVQFNNAGSLDASANLTFNTTTNILTLAGNIQTNNANLGNSAVANYFTGNFFGRANTANTVLVAAQPNITSLGTLTSLTVAGGVANLGNVGNVKILGSSGYLYNDSSNNLTYQTVVTQSIPGTANSLLYSSGSNNVLASGNIKFNDPQLVILGTLSVSGNANVGNIGATNAVVTSVSATTVTGTLTTNAQPNITSVGTLAGLTVSSAGLVVSGAGNINAGNITATGVFAGNGANLTTLTGSNVTGTVANATYAVSAGSATSATNAAALLTTLTTTGTVFIPFISATANGNYAHLSNANFSANLANGAITATTFVGALSGAATSATTAGTVTTNAQPNITSVGTLTTLSVTGNANVGNLGTARILATANVTSPQLISNIATGTAPFVVTSTTQVANLSVATSGTATTAGTVTTNAQPNITSVGTLSALAVTGNTTSGNVYANSGTIGASLLTGTLTTAAQPNITSVGTLTGLTANGNVTVNQTAAQIFTVQATQPPTTDMVVITNTGQNVATAGVSAMQVTYVGGAGAIEASAIRSDMTPGTTSGSTWNAFRVAATAAANTGVTFNGVKFDNKTAGAGTSTMLYAGTGYDNILNYNGTTVINGNGTVVGGQVVGAVSSATTSGTVTTNAQPNITSVGTLTSLGVSGAVTASTLVSNVATGTAPLTVTSTTRVANLNVNYANVADFISVAAGTGNNFIIFANAATGNITELTSTGLIANLSNNSITATTFVGALSGAATTAGTVTTNAQPNITSVGTLTSMTSSGNIQGANVIATAYHIRSVGTAIIAAGFTQGTGTALTKEMNIVSTVSTGNGVVLPTAVAGMVLTITNTSANSLLVYPATGGAINSLATNVGFTQPATATLQFIAPSSTQWYTVGATYA